MITYDLAKAEGPLYKYLYDCIRADIRAGRFAADTKMPSKRMLAKNLGVSTITVENAYEQLISEGYLYAQPKRGYFVAELADIGTPVQGKKPDLHIQKPERQAPVRFDFSSNQIEQGSFPFSVWARLMRETISVRERELLEVSPCAGVAELREAIARHLASFRGMTVDPDQIVVGAGTEYMYSLLIKLLGTDLVYCMENPGYGKLEKIYASNGIKARFAEMDEQGIRIDDLRRAGADIAHISPTHHFPTGITMPVSRRYELLAWANEAAGRYIIEDDYDSEFRLNGKPIPPLESIDACEKVIYMNTFSKSLTSTIRISYVVLPAHLANRFYQTLSFYSCTVSTFEQYTLAAFIRQGYLEKHINRMRLHYGRKRTRVLEMIRKVFLEDECRIMENDSGLHFLLELQTQLSDWEVKERLFARGIRISTVAEYDHRNAGKDRHQFILNYSNIDPDGLEEALKELRSVIRPGT